MEGSKFKVGDLVLIVGNTCGGVHGVGTTGWITEGDGASCWRISPKNDPYERDNWYAEEDLKLMESPTLSDKPSDNVNHPTHYNESGIECIEAIRASLGDEFPAYCKGNVMKYLWRYQYKNGIEDLKKAQVYLNWMVEYLEENHT